MPTIEKKDNSNRWLKAAIRNSFLPKKASVLDLFCGTGEMYRRCYDGKVAYYHGVDRKTIHDKAICTLANNESFVATHDISRYDVFDVDDYGCPWKLLFMLLARVSRPEITVFLTDGLPLRLDMNSRPAKFSGAVNRIPVGMQIPSLSRWYPDMFGTMLAVLQQRYGYKATISRYAWNEGKTVCYWYIVLKRAK